MSAFFSLRWGPTPSACQRSPRLAPFDRAELLLSQQRVSCYCTSISATLFTPLSAITRLPSFVGIMFRTTPPPEGMVQV